MSKRFTDTDKWSRPKFRKLSPEMKLFWIYILDNCDHAGVWVKDFEAASFFIGTKITEEKVKATFGDSIINIDNGEKLFVIDFIKFQYGELNSANKAHQGVMTVLKRYNIDLQELNRYYQGAIKGLCSPYQGVQDKDKVKDKDKVLEGECEGGADIIVISDAIEEPFGWTDDYTKLWAEWINYKWKQHKFKYKTPAVEFVGKKKLIGASGGDIETARQIIEESNRKWVQGIF